MLRRLLFANFKLVYRISQWMRYRFTSSGMLILLVMPIAGVFGFDTRSTLSHQIFSITLVLLIIAISYALFFRGRYSIKRVLPEYGTVDVPLYYSCFIKNHTNKPKKGLILIDNLYNYFPSFDIFKNTRDPLDKKRNRIDRYIGYPRLVNIIQRMRGGSIQPVSIEYIAEKSETKTLLSLVPLRRGYLYFNKMNLSKTDPLGLFRAKKTYVQKDKILILPKLYKVPKLNLQGKRTYQHGGVNNATSVGDSQEFISLRDYRPGDPLKSIHWRSYAKTNEPIVKEYQDEFFIRHGLILDTYLDINRYEIFEDAVSVAASFVSAQQEYDSLLDLMFIGNNAYRFTSGRGLIGTENTLEILACIEPVFQSNLEKLERLIKQYAHECSALICVLLNLDNERRELLKTFSEFNLPVKVLLVTDTDIDQDEIIDKHELIDINIIHHASLQNDLNNLR